MNNYISNKIILIPPYHFSFNPETADTNFFQHTETDNRAINLMAMNEFEEVINKLDEHKINFYLLDNLPSEDITPDAVFPNWFSVHSETGKRVLVIYPMLTENRRREVRIEELAALLYKAGLEVDEIIDMRPDAKNGEALEANGSISLDRQNKIAYASLSPRTNKSLLEKWCYSMGYRAVAFESTDLLERVIYHTDLMLNVWKDFSIVCADAITDEKKKEDILELLHQNSLYVLQITPDQLTSMCGNIIQLATPNGESKVVLSKNAYQAFSESQRKFLEKIGDLVILDIPTIESIGGGGTRCMIAELF